MSHSSYTASERRGILVIAILSLLLIGGGVAFSLFDKNADNLEAMPVVEEMPQLIDSVSLLKNEDKIVMEEGGKDKEISKKKGETKGSKSRTDKRKGKSDKKRNKPLPRKRSPLDEPV